MIEHKLDINKVITSGLTLEQYFILYCIFNNADELMAAYTKNKPIDPLVYQSLRLLDYVNIGLEQEHKYYGLLSLTPKGRLVLQPRAEMGENDFEGFRKHYPTAVKFGPKVRRLQGNLAVCKKLYEKLLLETSHDILCKCAKAYWNEQAKNDGGWYTKLLEGWLRQKLYLNYVEDIDNINLDAKIDDFNNLDAI